MRFDLLFLFDFFLHSSFIAELIESILHILGLGQGHDTTIELIHVQQSKSMRENFEINETHAMTKEIQLISLE